MPNQPKVPAAIDVFSMVQGIKYRSTTVNSTPSNNTLRRNTLDTKSDNENAAPKTINYGEVLINLKRKTAKDREHQQVVRDFKKEIAVMHEENSKLVQCIEEKDEQLDVKNEEIQRLNSTLDEM